MKTGFALVYALLVVSGCRSSDERWKADDCTDGRHVDQPLTFKGEHGREVYCERSVDGQPQKHGLYEMFYANGNRLTRCHMRKGICVGKIESWFPNGNKLSEIETSEDLLHLVRFEGYWDNGQKMFSGGCADNGTVLSGARAWKQDGSPWNDVALNNTFLERCQNWKTEAAALAGK